MKICDELRQAVLQAAIKGKLTRQRKEDGDARDLLKQIAEEKAQLIKEKKLKKEKPLPEITEDELPFDIPDNWVWVRIGTIFKTSSGTTPSRSKSEYYCLNGINWVRTTDLNNGVLRSCEINITELAFNECRLEILPRESVCIALYGGAGTIGKNALIDFDTTINQSVCAIHPNKCNMRYIHIFTKYFRQFWMDFAAGSRKDPNINQIIVKNTLIPVPPLAEQYRIVSKVEKLIAEIDELEKVENKLIALKEAFPGDMKAALLQEAMQGKLTEQLKSDGNARDLLKEIKAEKEALIKAGKLKKEKPLTEIGEDEIPFDIPENWEWVRLNDLVLKNVKRGKSPTYSDKGRALVFAQKCNVKAGGINMELALHLDDSKLAKYPEEEYMHDADIVVNSTGTGTMGRVGLFRDTDRIGDMPIVPDSHVTVVRFGNVTTALYMYYFLKSKQEYLEENGDGSTNQKELKPLTIMSLLVPLPPLAEQKRIVAKLDKLLPLCDSLVEA